MGGRNSSDEFAAARVDPDEVQPNECHTCGHTAEWCECETPSIDAPDPPAAYEALLDDTLTLMDQHTSEEVKMEARRRIIEREIQREAELDIPAAEAGWDGAP